jgi:hypothetical protein
MEIQQIIFLAIIGSVAYYFWKNKNNNTNNNSKDTIKEKKTIPEITDTKAIQLFDLIKIDYKKLAFDKIEIYSPIGTEYCYELFEKSENEFSRSGKDEYIVYSAKTTKPFHGIFKLIKAKYRVGYFMINYPLSGGLYFISGDPETIDLNNVIEFAKKLITILGNPLAYDGEELDINKIKKSILKDKKDLNMFWSDIFSITDEDGDTAEHSVSFFYNYEDSIYKLWIA